MLICLDKRKNRDVTEEDEEEWSHEEILPRIPEGVRTRSQANQGKFVKITTIK